MARSTLKRTTHENLLKLSGFSVYAHFATRLASELTILPQSTTESGGEVNTHAGRGKYSQIFVNATS